MTDTPARVSVPLTADDARALVAMAQAECRHPREQMRSLLRDAARARGLLPDPIPFPQPDAPKRAA